jgi:hydroxycarboxylate dehydrogenase B
VEILGGILAGEASSLDSRYTNGLCLMALDPGAFCGRERFELLMDDLVAYITATPPAPGFGEVAMPGAPEFRTRERRLREGIPVPDETWRQIAEAAKRVRVGVDEGDPAETCV